jgi:hypothetical protein
LLKQNIRNQTFAAAYAAYHPRYKAFKSWMAPNAGYHVLKGDFMRNISVFREIKQTTALKIWMGGVHYSAMDSGGKSWYKPWGTKGKPKPIAMYIRVMEKGMQSKKGSGDHPKRELFRPTMFHYIATGAWTARGAEFLEILKRSWI